MRDFEHILVATDFTPASDAALAYARDFARRFGATLHVLHAVEMPPLYAVDADGHPAVLVQPKDIEAEARGRLERVVTADDRQALHAATVIRTGETPADAIAHYAAAHEIDLVIVGTHGRRSLARFLLGSVAEKVGRMAPCPVLTIQPAQVIPAPALAFATAH